MKRFLSSLVVVLFTGAFYAADFNVDGISYNIVTLSELTCEVTYPCSGTNLILPNTVTYKGREFTVLGIGNYAFDSSNIETVVIGDKLQYIGKEAFSICMRLKSVTIPASVTTIGEEAFYGCDDLKELILEDTSVPLSGKLSDISRVTPFWRDQISKVYIGRPISSNLMDDAFNWSIQQLTIGDLVTEFSDKYLMENDYGTLGSLHTLTIGAGLQLVPYFHEGDNIRSIYVRTKRPQTSAGFNEGTFVMATLYVPKGTKALYEQADVWKNFWEIQEYDFEGIGDEEGGDEPYVPDFYANAVRYRVLDWDARTCEVMKAQIAGEVRIPGQVNYNGLTFDVLGIGEEAFRSSAITSLVIENGPTYIGSNATSASDVTKIVIPPSVTTISDWCFSFSTGLQTVIIQDGTELLDWPGSEDLFSSDCHPFRSTTPTVLYLGRNCNPKILTGTGFSSLEELTIGNAVTTWVTMTLGSLLKLTIGEGLESVPQLPYATKLKEIHLTSIVPQPAGGFADKAYTDATLYVPFGSKLAYQNDPVWGKFWNIVESDSPLAIESIKDVNPGTTSVYTPSGIKTDNSFKGIQILRQGNRTIKIIRK